MKKRLRKKKRLGDFREYGFEVAFRMRPQSDSDTVFDAFIREAIEANGLLFGGSPDGGFVTSQVRRASATEADREAVGNWLQRRAEVFDIHVCELRDAWHGWESR